MYERRKLKIMKKLILALACGGFLISCQQGSQSVVNTAKASEKAATEQSDVWLESLITETPQEGRELAIMMARKTIGAIQSDPEVKKKIRAQYAEKAEPLILSAQVVATEFQTVAEANNYWRK